MSEQVSEIAWTLYEYCPPLSDGARVSSDWLLRTLLATWAWLASINWRYWTNTIVQTAQACLEAASQADPLYILILGRKEKFFYL